MNLLKLEKLQILSPSEKVEALVEYLEEESDAEQFFRLFFDTKKYFVNAATILKALQLAELADEGLTLQHIYCKYPSIDLAVENLVNSMEFASFYDLEALLQELHTARGAIQTEMLASIFKTSNSLFSKWLVKFLLKDMFNGVSVGLINKAFAKKGLELITFFAPQLCGSYHTLEEVPKTSDFYPVICSKKYDGYRCLIFKKGLEIEMLSRSGKVINNLPEIATALIEVFKDASVILDGEVIASNFNDIQHRISRKLNNIEKIDNLCYRIFDILELKETKTKSLAQLTRTSLLSKFWKSESINHPLIKLEEFIIAANFEELKQFYLDIIEAKGEGIVIKLLDRPYEFDNRKNWFKLKAIQEDTFIISGYSYGKGKYNNLVSSLTIEDSTKTIQSKVGSGLTNEDVQLITRLAAENRLIGTKVDICYFEKTAKSLRLPRFLKLRLGE